MTPENKVTSLETARRLKAAGFPQNTEREWKEGGRLGGKQYTKLLYRDRPALFSTADSAWGFYAAPDATELLDWIHEQIRTCGNHIDFSVDWHVSGWEVNVRNSGSGEREKFGDKNLSDAIAEAAFYVIKRYKKLL